MTSSNKRSQDNNQTDNMANEKSVSSARGGTTENYSKQPGAEGTGMPGGGSKQSGTQGSQQSQGGIGSPRTERGAGTGGAGQSQADLGAGSQQSGSGGYQVSQGRGHKAQGSLECDTSQVWRGSEAGEQPLADGLSRQSQQDRPDQQRGGQSKGGSTLYGTGQGQHAQSSGGHEGADTAKRVVKEGAGMPAQGDVGRSAQTGASGLGPREAKTEGKTVETTWQESQNDSLQSGTQQGNAGRDSAAGSAQLSGSTDSANTDNTGEADAQTGSQQYGLIDDVGTQRYSNDSAGGLPRSPAGKHLSAEQDMNDDTGLSNTSNRQELDMGTKQEKQSNVGRRSDMTPD